MSSTRPKRILIPESASPRRSTRIRESPGIDYSPSKPRSVRRARSRSRSRVLKDSHGGADESMLPMPSLPESRLLPPLKSPRGLDFQSDDEDESSPIKAAGRVDGKLMNVLDGFNGFNVVHSFSRIKDVTINTTKETLETLSKVKNLRWSDRDKVKSYLASSDWRKPLFCLCLLVLMVLAYRFNSFIQKDAEPDRFIVLLSCVMAPVRQLLDSTRLAYLSLPGLLWSGGGGVEPVTQTHGHVTVDYDVLVDKILDNQRFSSMIELLSRGQLASLESDLSRKMVVDLETIRANTASQQNRISKEIENEISEVKQLIDTEIRKSSSGKSAVDIRLSELETDLDGLHTRVRGMAATVTDHEAGQTVDSGDVDQLVVRLDSLEAALPHVRSLLTSCCDDKPDLDNLVTTKLNSFMADNATSLAAGLTPHFVTQSQHEANVLNLEAELIRLKDSLEAEVEQETHRINTKIEAVAAKALQMKIERTDQVSFQAGDVGFVEGIVKAALAKYDADKTGLFDFALESAGGSIFSTRCTENYELSSAVMSVWGVPIWWETNTPRSILQPGTAPGQCWAFRGSHGAVVIKLSAKITPKAVSVEHISPLSTPDGQLASAPKNIAIGGLVGDTLVPIANITYDKAGEPVQTFWFTSQQQQFDSLEFNILSNHGHPDYTCIYRLRVHGDLTEEDKVH